MLENVLSKFIFPRPESNDKNQEQHALSLEDQVKGTTSRPKRPNNVLRKQLAQKKKMVTFDDECADDDEERNSLVVEKSSAIRQQSRKKRRC